MPKSNWDHFPRDRGENKKYLKNHHIVYLVITLIRIKKSTLNTSQTPIPIVVQFMICYMFDILTLPPMCNLALLTSKQNLAIVKDPFQLMHFEEISLSHFAQPLGSDFFHDFQTKVSSVSRFSPYNQPKKYEQEPNKKLPQNPWIDPSLEKKLCLCRLMAKKKNRKSMVGVHIGLRGLRPKVQAS